MRRERHGSVEEDFASDGTGHGGVGKVINTTWIDINEGDDANPFIGIDSLLNNSTTR